MKKTKKQISKSHKKVEMKQMLNAYLKEGYSVKKSMELAGYSPSTIETQAKRTVANNIDVDELHRTLKGRSLYANHLALDVAEEMMDPKKEDKTRSYGAKLALDNAKIHLGKDQTPPNITFRFTAINIEDIEPDK